MTHLEPPSAPGPAHEPPAQTAAPRLPLLSMTLPKVWTDLLLILTGSLLLSVVAAAALSRWDGQFQEVCSSTGAWIVAQTVKALQVDSYAAATTLDRVPNTQSNIVYQGLIMLVARSPLAEVLGGPVAIAHLISAAGWGLCFVPLFLIGRRAGGLLTGVAAVTALFFPPLVATAALIRYDTWAMALTLWTAWAALEASLASSWWRWIGVGALVGLTYHAREYLVAPAGMAALVALAASSWHPPVGSRSRRRQLSTAAFLLADGMLLGLVIPPRLLGLPPLNGLLSLLSYAGPGAPSNRHDSLAEIFYHPYLTPVFLAGLLGLLLGLWGSQGPARRAWLLLLATVSAFALFPLAHQQSAQYYLLAQVLLLTGLLGFARLPRPVWAQLVLIGILVVAGLPTMVREANAMLSRAPGEKLVFHHEAWPVPGKEARAAMDWLHARAGQGPLIIFSRYMENFDALFIIHHRRPVAFLFNDWALERLPDIRQVYAPLPSYVCLLESRQDAGRLPALAPQPIDTFATEGLFIRLYRLEAPASPSASAQPFPCDIWRGVCLQQTWLKGGEAAVWQAYRTPGPGWAGGNPGLYLPWMEAP